MKRFLAFLFVVVLGLIFSPAATAVEVTPQPPQGWWQVEVLSFHTLPCLLKVELWRDKYLLGQRELSSPPTFPPLLVSAVAAAPLAMPEFTPLGKIHFSYPLRLKFEPGQDCPAGLDYISEANASLSDWLPLLGGEGSPFKGWVGFWQGEDPFWLVTVFLKIEPTLPVRHPVVFIHGLGGKPEDWVSGNKKMYWEKLTQLGWPATYRTSYAYADYNHDGWYDYQGDIREIENDLPDLVTRLADTYTTEGGDCQRGCVDLVGFSLGGLVAREYLNEHPFDHQVRKLVTIGTPHRGVDWLHLRDWLDSNLLRGTFIEEALTNLGSSIINTVRSPNGQPLDVNSPSFLQLHPNSSFISDLNSLLVEVPEVDLLYGKIDAQLHQELFFFDFKKEFSIGDVLIFENSATGAPYPDKVTYEFSDRKVVDLQLGLRQNEKGGTFRLQIDTPNFEELRFEHTNLVRQPEVVDRVFKILSLP